MKFCNSSTLTAMSEDDVRVLLSLIIDEIEEAEWSIADDDVLGEASALEEIVDILKERGFTIDTD